MADKWVGPLDLKSTDMMVGQKAVLKVVHWVALMVERMVQSTVDLMVELLVHMMVEQKADPKDVTTADWMVD